MSATTKPVFIGGTIDEHLLFVVALCRFQHHTLPLAPVHYVTWSVAGIALHVLAFSLGGPVGPIVLALALTAWAMRLDVRIGPRPPARVVAGLPRLHKAAFAPYFVVTFGSFFLTLDLAMRFLGHRRDLNLRANAIAAGWHEDVVSATVAVGDESRELRLHRRAITELSS